MEMQAGWLDITELPRAVTGIGSNTRANLVFKKGKKKIIFTSQYIFLSEILSSTHLSS